MSKIGILVILIVVIGTILGVTTFPRHERVKKHKSHRPKKTLL